MKIQVKNRDSARKIPLRTKCAFNLPSLDQMRPIKTWLIADVPLGKIIDPSAFPISSDNLFARCLLSGLRENMRTVSGAQGPLSRHGQSSGPIRRYGGACWRVWHQPLENKISVIIGRSGTAVVARENPYQATIETMTRKARQFMWKWFFFSSFIVLPFRVLHCLQNTPSFSARVLRYSIANYASRATEEEME